MADENESEDRRTHTETRLDADRLVEDFGRWLDSAPQPDDSRFERAITNLVHMALTVGTGGAYLLVYFGYYVFRFKQTIDLEDYQKDFEVSEKVDEEE